MGEFAEASYSVKRKGPPNIRMARHQRRAMRTFCYGGLRLPSLPDRQMRFTAEAWKCTGMREENDGLRILLI